jgi:hypothetical protein
MRRYKLLRFWKHPFDDSFYTPVIQFLRTPTGFVLALRVGRSMLEFMTWRD